MRCAAEVGVEGLPVADLLVLGLRGVRERGLPMSSMVIWLAGDEREVEDEMEEERTINECARREIKNSHVMYFCHCA